MDYEFQKQYKTIAEAIVCKKKKKIHILLRIVLGRTRFGYCFVLFLKFIIYMYAPSYFEKLY